MPSLKDKTVASATVSESAFTRRQPDVPGEPPPASPAGAATVDISPHPLIDGTSVARGLMHSTLPVVVFDAELRISWANEAAGKTTCDGSAAHWRGRPLGEVMPGIDVGPIEQSLRGVLQTGCPAVDLQVSGPPCGNARRYPDRGRTHRRGCPCLADGGAVELLDTVIKGDNPARPAIDDGSRLRRVAMRWPGGSRVAPADHALCVPSAASSTTSPPARTDRPDRRGIPSPPRRCCPTGR